MKKMTSFLGKHWTLPKSGDGDVLERLLKLRGIKPEQRESFLNPKLPSTNTATCLKDLPKAVARITQAIENKERILICGDYDVDGVTASALLFKTLQHLKAEVSVRLPHRMQDGYGLNENMIREASKAKVKLIITVDNGITSTAEVTLASELGIDVIITDHHLPPAELPAALAILNPRQTDCPYPDKNLSGVGVAYRLALALLANTNHQQLTDELLALTALGTIADVCPLIGENRGLVTQGLQALAKTQNPGLRRIFENCGITGTISSEDVGFRIGPRLNAAGRLDSALVAFQALSHPSQAVQFANRLEELNLERRQHATEHLDDALERLGEIGKEKLLLASSPDWHAGVIGLTAGRLAEQFFRPVILMEERDTEFIGSCRSPIPELNITDALTEVADLLTNFGGHRAAAGFTLQAEHRVEFEKRLRKIIERELEKVELAPLLTLDLNVMEVDLTLGFYQTLQQLAPFGAGNPEPLLLWKQAPLADLKTVGADDKHLSLGVGKTKIKAIGFGLGEAIEQLKAQPIADLAFTLDLNEWRGKQSLQLRLVDWR